MTATLSSRGWKAWLPGFILLTLLIALFRDTAIDMVRIWIRSETFQHAFLVPPIAAWLIWRRRAEVASAVLRPVPWLLLPMGAVCFAWLLGDLVEVAAASQLALVTLGVLLVPALFGWHLTRLLLFPLMFLFFMVPFGEFAVPFLQEWTADVTVLALRLTGIPVYREGMQFVIPSGTWSVVEACSGVRYIIACVMVGTLFAYLNYRSLQKRLTFVVVALLVPVAANWIRAYTIVIIGHLTGSPMIMGVEHTTYGWFLFGAVVMVMFWVGSYWADDESGVDASMASKPGNRLQEPPRLSTGLLAVGIALLLSLTQLWARSLQPDMSAPPLEFSLPEQLGDWRADGAERGLGWQPGFLNPSLTRIRTYRRGEAVVRLWLGFYRQQSAERKLVTTRHRVVAPGIGAWRSQATGLRPAEHDLPSFVTSVVSSGVAPSLTTSTRERVWYVYWVDGRWMVRPAEVKLRQAFGRLRGRSDDGAIVMLVARMDDDADRIMEEFARAHLSVIGATLEATGESEGLVVH